MSAIVPNINKTYPQCTRVSAHNVLLDFVCRDLLIPCVTTLMIRNLSHKAKTRGHTCLMRRLGSLNRFTNTYLNCACTTSWNDTLM